MINNICIYNKLFKELKIGIEILVGQAVFKLWIKTARMMFGSITQEPLGLPKFLKISHPGGKKTKTTWFFHFGRNWRTLCNGAQNMPIFV